MAKVSCQQSSKFHLFIYFTNFNTLFIDHNRETMVAMLEERQDVSTLQVLICLSIKSEYLK